MEDGEYGQAREHASLLAGARALRLWERGRDEVQGSIASVAIIPLLQCDELAILGLLQLAEKRTGTLGYDETLDTLTALAVEPDLEAL